MGILASIALHAAEDIAMRAAVDVAEKSDERQDERIESTQKATPKAIHFVIKQRKDTIRERFEVFDDDDNLAYVAKGELISAKRKAHVFDSERNELGVVAEKLLTIRSPFDTCIDPVDFGLEVFGSQTVRMSSDNGFDFELDNGWSLKSGSGELPYYVTNGHGKTILRFGHYSKVFEGRDIWALTVGSMKDALLGLMIVLAIDMNFEPEKRTEEMKDGLDYKLS
ncbi:MAG: hypothetical protein WAY93_05370 [Atopobiaceae bacterium]|nr:hypothetical protein [Atopobiaceae bacterium]